MNRRHAMNAKLPVGTPMLESAYASKLCFFLLAFSLSACSGLQIKSSDLATCDDSMQLLPFDTVLVSRLGREIQCDRVLARVDLRQLDVGDRFACKTSKVNGLGQEGYNFNFNINPAELQCKPAPFSSGHDLVCERVAGSEAAFLIITPVSRDTRVSTLTVCAKIPAVAARGSSCPDCPICQKCPAAGVVKPKPGPRQNSNNQPPSGPRPSPQVDGRASVQTPPKVSPKVPDATATSIPAPAPRQGTIDVRLQVRGATDPPDPVVKLRRCNASPAFKLGAAGFFADGPLKSTRFTVKDVASCAIVIAGNVDAFKLVPDSEVTLTLPDEARNAE